MGGGSSYHERPLSNEEKQMYAQQTKYMQTIQPAIEKMVSTGLNNLNDVYTPDWNSMASNYTVVKLAYCHCVFRCIAILTESYTIFYRITF